MAAEKKKVLVLVNFMKKIVNFFKKISCGLGWLVTFNNDKYVALEPFTFAEPSS